MEIMMDLIGDKVVFNITITNTSNDRIDDLVFVDTITSSRGNVNEFGW